MNLRHTLLACMLLSAAAARALFVQENGIIPETCGNSNGEVHMMVGGGVPPYSFSWSNGATTQDLIGVPEGSYMLTVTDDVGTVVYSADVVVQNYDFLPFSEGGSYLVPDGLGGEMWGGACPGQCNGQMAMPFALFGGTPPFNVNWNASGPIGVTGVNPDMSLVYSGFCLGETVTYTYTDAHGCAGSGSHTIIGVDSVPGIAAVHGACGGGANGRVEIHCPGWIYLPPSMQIYRDGSWVASPNYPQPAPATIQVQNLIAGEYELRMHWYGACPTVVPFTIPALSVACGTVSGTNFLDDDQDCAPDAGEVRRPYQVLSIEPVGEWALTGANGDFVFALPNGSYTLGHSAPGVVPLCPLPQPVPFTVNSDATVIQLADSSTAPLDIAIYAAGSAARPGFVTTHYATVRNLSAKVSGAVQVVHTFDPVLVYIAAAPPPTSVVGNVITWDLPQLTAYAYQDLSIQCTVPAPTPLGTVLSSSMSAQCALTDADLSNNADAVLQTVTGSYDPNDKTARTSSGWSDVVYYIDQDEWVDYTIRFQNTGTDTAFTVVIADTLPAELDMASFQQGVASHDFDVAFRPGRVVEWTFADILLPDSNVNEPLSHGLISFRIRPHQPLLPGTVIENTANIYFDFNPAVITDPSVLMAEFGTGAEALATQALIAYPNPTSDVLFVQSEGLGVETWLVRTLDGRAVMSTSMRSTRVALDVAALDAGTYVIEVRGGNGVEVLLFNKTR